MGGRANGGTFPCAAAAGIFRDAGAAFTNETALTRLADSPPSPGGRGGRGLHACNIAAAVAGGVIDVRDIATALTDGCMECRDTAAGVLPGVAVIVSSGPWGDAREIQPSERPAMVSAGVAAVVSSGGGGAAGETEGRGGAADHNVGDRVGHGRSAPFRAGGVVGNRRSVPDSLPKVVRNRPPVPYPFTAVVGNRVPVPDRAANTVGNRAAVPDDVGAAGFIFAKKVGNRPAVPHLFEAREARRALVALTAPRANLRNGVIRGRSGARVLVRSRAGACDDKSGAVLTGGHIAANWGEPRPDGMARRLDSQHLCLDQTLTRRPMPDFIPRPDTEMADFSGVFVRGAVRLAEAAHIPMNLVDELVAAHAVFRAAFDRARDPDTATWPVTREKIQTRRALERAIRPVAGWMRRNPVMSDADLISMGLKARRTDRGRRLPPPSVAPTLSLQQVVGRTLHLRIYDSSGRAKPGGGVQSAEVFVAVGESVPASLKEWTLKRTARRRRFTIDFAPLEAGTPVWVAARWVNPCQQPGPASTPIHTRLGWGLSAARALGAG